MNYLLKEDIIPDLQDLIDLYEDAGWVNYTQNTGRLMNAFKNSLFILSAWDDKKLIGIIRIVGDGYSIIYIQDILVRKEYQHMGVGSKLFTEVMNKYSGVYQTVLLTDDEPRTKAFYRSMGLVTSDTFGCISFVKYKQ